MAQFVTIYTSMSLSEIYVVQGHLEAIGITSFTRDERITQMAPYISSLTNGIQLQVHSADIERAVDLLQEAGYLVPRVSKNDGFGIKAGIIFLLVLALGMAYLLHSRGLF